MIPSSRRSLSSSLLLCMLLILQNDLGFSSPSLNVQAFVLVGYAPHRTMFSPRQQYHSENPSPSSWSLSASFFDNNNNENDSNSKQNMDASRFSTTTTTTTTTTPSSTPRPSAAAVNNSNDNNPTNAFVGGLVREMDIMKSQLFAAFTNLDLTDQYDAVLTGMCAKLLDNVDEENKATEEEKMEENYYQNRLQDCRALLQEMTKSRIVASPRSIMALIDCTVKLQDASIMAAMISDGLRNRALTQYGSQQTDIALFPSSRYTKVRLADGSIQTYPERLKNVPDVPTDDRVAEIANAIAFTTVLVGCELVNWWGPEDFRLVANSIVSLAMLTVVLDNFYDVLTNVLGFVWKQNDITKKWELPEKEDLPLGLGTGQTTGSIVRGWTRLLSVHPEREAQCEAAALYAGYVLGLPCFAFQPNAYEASVLVVDSYNNNINNENKADTLLSLSGILRILIWLYSPVAMENSKYPQLVVSDPREAAGFLQRLEEYYASTDPGGVVLFWDDEESKADLLKWAYTEADLLLRRNKAPITEIANRLTGGAATIADCVAVIENF